MSIRVSPEELPAAVELYGPTGYVLTTGAEGRPQVTHCTTEVTPGRITVRLGPGATGNARDRPAVAVLWPATKDQSMSLIADGVAAVVTDVGSEADEAEGAVVEIEVSGAVRHRPAPPLT